MSITRAPAARWRRPVWSTGRKDCTGTGLGHSRLWFTIGRGIVTEIFYPRIDIPQIRDLGFLIADGQGFWQEIKALPNSTLDLEDPRTPFPHIHHRHERYQFSFQVCTDPDRDVLLIDFALTGDADLRPYLLCAPRLGADARTNRAWVGSWEGRAVLWVEQGPFGLAISCRDPDGRSALGPCAVGEVGASDLWQDFHLNGRMTWGYAEAGPGEVALGGALPPRGTLALGLGTSKEAAATAAWSSLAEGFPRAADEYTTRWLAWHELCCASQDIASQLPPDIATLYTRSATVIKVHEDRTFPGALVASLSVPWGETSDTLGGYHLVWARDLVESAGALLALGAHKEARQVLAYLISTQRADGHWLQNQWLGGKPFWNGMQLDEVGFPVLLASALKAHDALGDITVTDMILRALSFIVRKGPVTAQDRWEEDAGINTFTLAVIIAALVEGAMFLDGRARSCALMFADYWNARIESWTYTEDDPLSRQFQVPGHYIRVAPPDVLTDQEAEREILPIKNRANDPRLAACCQISNDFLQLVRYGLRDARDPHILASVTVMDGLLKTETPSGPVWHRYNGDGYGEHADGRPFDGTGTGRGWPLLTGERGHYAVAAGDDALPYLQAMAAMAGQGGLLPEQVWDSAPIPKYDLTPGRPSGSAMPLVWAHGEFVKLCHSHVLGVPIDRPVATWRRYRGVRPTPDFRIWQLHQQPRHLRVGEELRIALSAPFTVHWGQDGWQNVCDTPSEDWGLLQVAILPRTALRDAHSLQFTLRWAGGDWIGQDFHIDIRRTS
ncbi:glycoside hydrolase family 15 protein [Acidiferrobacter sp.]|uniref:glycoside hydrolase family 15 protein n=1 Tax=Acidiferrobacter sp. TaxID=1872107 RepID=UPI0026368701|nr:glycoside hydrolase family 15 protein [Acidiferrobacter sp.]